MPDAERLEGGQTRTEQAGVAAAQMAVVASSEALSPIAEATPAEIEDMVRQLDRLSADAVTCLENATRASEQADVTADAIEGADGRLLAAMLEHQQEQSRSYRTHEAFAAPGHM